MAGRNDRPTPVLVCWYSGGFRHKDGVALLAPVLEAAKQYGVRDRLVLGFPDHYGITGEGYDPWPGYVDRLVSEIDDKLGFKDRPLLLFGHSRGCEAAMSVATRLGSRVLKVYVAACGPIQLGEPTAWENMSRDMKVVGGNRPLLEFFAGLQPGNLLLTRTAKLPDTEMEAEISGSPWLSDTIQLMRVQYQDATYPRMMGESPDIGPIAAPIFAVAASLDPGSQPWAMNYWAQNTTGGFELITITAGHMDVLSAPTLQEALGLDMAHTSSDPHRCPFLCECLRFEDETDPAVWPPQRARRLGVARLAWDLASPDVNVRFEACREASSLESAAAGPYMELLERLGDGLDPDFDIQRAARKTWRKLSQAGAVPVESTVSSAVVLALENRAAALAEDPGWRAGVQRAASPTPPAKPVPVKQARNRSVSPTKHVEAYDLLWSSSFERPVLKAVPVDVGVPDKEVVMVHYERGPQVLLETGECKDVGRIKQLMISVVTPGERKVTQAWSDLSSTQCEVLLHIVAKRNRLMRERKGWGPGFPPQPAMAQVPASTEM